MLPQHRRRDDRVERYGNLLDMRSTRESGGGSRHRNSIQPGRIDPSYGRDRPEQLVGTLHDVAGWWDEPPPPLGEAMMRLGELVAGWRGDDVRHGQNNGKVRRLVRECGRTFRETQGLVKSETRLTCNVFRTLKSPRGSGYYDALHATGARILNGGEVLLAETASLLVEYPVVSGVDIPIMDSPTCLVKKHLVSVPLWVVRHVIRRDVTLTDSVPSREIVDSDLNQLQLGKNASREKCGAYLKLGKHDFATLSTSQTIHIKEVIGRLSGESKLMRFVKGWCYYIYMCVAGLDAMPLPASAMDGVNQVTYTAHGVATACNAALANRTSVIYTDAESMSVKRFMSLMVGEFPKLPLRDGGRELEFGGFSIPSEVSKGDIYIMSNGVGDIRDGDVTISRDDVYAAINQYAAILDRCEECRDGYCLAWCLLFSHGVPNFSLPKSQGLLDIFLPVVTSYKKDSRLVGPEVEPALVGGCFTVMRQCLGQLKDMMAVGSDTRDYPDFMDVSLTNVGVRHLLYKFYADNYFGPGYDIMYHVDPMVMVCPAREAQLDRISFLDAYWGYRRIGTCIRGSWHQYMLYGKWDMWGRLDSLDNEALRCCSATYLNHGLLANASHRYPWAVVLARGSLHEDTHDYYSARLMPGRLRTGLGQVVGRRHRRMPRVDFSKFSRVDMPIEGGGAVVELLRGSDTCRRKTRSAKSISVVSVVVEAGRPGSPAETQELAPTVLCGEAETFLSNTVLGDVIGAKVALIEGLKPHVETTQHTNEIMGCGAAAQVFGRAVVSQDSVEYWTKFISAVGSSDKLYTNFCAITGYSCSGGRKWFSHMAHVYGQIPRGIIVGRFPVAADARAAALGELSSAMQLYGVPFYTTIGGRLVLVSHAAKDALPIEGNNGEVSTYLDALTVCGCWGAYSPDLWEDERSTSESSN